MLPARKFHPRKAIVNKVPPGRACGRTAGVSLCSWFWKERLCVWIDEEDSGLRATKQSTFVLNLGGLQLSRLQWAGVKQERVVTTTAALYLRASHPKHSMSTAQAWMKQVSMLNSVLGTLAFSAWNFRLGVISPGNPGCLRLIPSLPQSESY